MGQIKISHFHLKGLILIILCVMCILDNRKTNQAENLRNKKSVLWNAGICPIASKIGHMTLATPPLGSFIVPYVVLAMAYPTKKKRRVYLHLFKSYGVRGPKI